MKTIKTSTIFLFVLFTIAACNKEEIEPKDVTSKNSTITLDNNRIKFDSYQDYESHIHNYELSEEPQKFIKIFNNTYKLKKSSAESDLPEALRDEFLESILNENNIVEIGDYLYRINLLTEKVYVMSSDYESDLIDLVSEDITNTNIMEFTTGDDVIDLVERLEGATSRGCGGIGGGVYETDIMTLGQVNGENINLQAGVVFFRAGIYFSLKGTVVFRPKSFDGTGVVKSALFMKSPGCWYKKKCTSYPILNRVPNN